MKKLNRKILSLFSYILVTLVVIIGLSAGTYSWLKKNVQVKSNNIPYTLDDSRGIAFRGVEIYKRDGKLGAVRVTELSRIDLTEYDMIFADRNIDTPIIYRVALDPVPVGKNIKWTLQCMDVADSWTHNGTASGYMYAYYSNICTIRVGTGYADLNNKYDKNHPDNNAEEIYSDAVDYLASPAVATPMSFVTEKYIGGANNKYEHERKVDEISGLLTVKEGDIQDGALVLYIELSYNAEAVESFMEDYELTGGIYAHPDTSTVVHGSGLEEAVNFENDLSAIRFDYVEQD